jgi:DNA polymerase III subunit delta
VQLRAEQLEAQLAKSLAPVYAVHGDEPLLALEAADAVRAAARKRGFAERDVFDVARGFDWNEFRSSLASMSLFATNKIVELRLPGGKPGAQGGEAIEAYCRRPSADILLLVALPRLDFATQKSAWFGALGESGVIVDVWPLDRSRLPAWIAQRLARQGQRAPREVLEFLADRVEGNLLAAHQEVQKLALLAPQGELSLEAVQDAVASVARYDPDDAAEALLARDTARYARIIEGLHGEGEEPTFVLFVLSRALFVLRTAARGGSLDAAFQQHRLFNKPMQRAIAAAAPRLSLQVIDGALTQAALIDRAIKGLSAREPWEELVKLGLILLGETKA